MILLRVIHRSPHKLIGDDPDMVLRVQKITFYGKKSMRPLKVDWTVPVADNSQMNR